MDIKTQGLAVRVAAPLILEWGGINFYFAIYSLPSEGLDVAARSAATLIFGFWCLFLWWEGSSNPK